MQRTALLAGATGLVGGECLQLLLSSPSYSRVIVVTRRALDSVARHPKVLQLVVDFAALASVQAELRADDVFCALGTTIKKAGSQPQFRAVDFGYPRQLAQLAREQGATHFSLVSALGANAKSGVFYSRTKGELEDAVRTMGWPSLCLLRPSVIAGERPEFRPIERLTEHVLRFAPRAWRPVPAATIAAAMVQTALRAPAGVTVIESADISRAAAVR